MRVDCVDSRPRRLPSLSGVAGGASVTVVVVVVVVIVVVAAVVFPWSDSTSPESVLVPEFHPVSFSFLQN